MPLKLSLTMTEKHSVTQEKFDALLDWLDDNREAAGEKYEKIRRRLILILAGRGCFEAEELADQTINRVISKLPQVLADYRGEPAFYFHSVANYVHQEWLRKQDKLRTLSMPEISEAENTDDFRYECLDSCLAPLPADHRRIIIEYYRNEKKVRIEYRRKLAEELGISVNALQVKIFRIRKNLQECVQKCVSEKY